MGGTGESANLIYCRNCFFCCCYCNFISCVLLLESSVSVPRGGEHSHSHDHNISNVEDHHHGHGHGHEHGHSHSLKDLSVGLSILCECKWLSYLQFLKPYLVSLFNSLSM